MDEIMIVFWTGTGNTANMAQYVEEGIQEAGKSAKLVPVEEANIEDLNQASTFALGCPSMGVEVLEESAMEPFVAEVEAFASGKNIGLFGSYGWGDGEWMRNWVDQMKGAGANVFGGEDAICQDAPDDEAHEVLKDLGKELAGL